MFVRCFACALAAIPVLDGEAIRGVVVVDRGENEAFTEREEDDLQARQAVEDDRGARIERGALQTRTAPSSLFVEHEQGKNQGEINDRGGEQPSRGRV